MKFSTGRQYIFAYTILSGEGTLNRTQIFEQDSSELSSHKAAGQARAGLFYQQIDSANHYINTRYKVTSTYQFY
jgi:hypothetical protein